VDPKTGKDVTKTFKFIECWRYLDGRPKWDSLVEAKRALVAAAAAAKDKATPTSAPAPQAETRTKASGVASERPTGVKAAKRIKREQYEAKGSSDRMATATAALADAMGRKASAQEVLAHTKVFQIDTSALDAEAKYFVQLQRKEIIHTLEQRRRKREAAQERDAADAAQVRAGQGCSDWDKDATAVVDIGDIQ